MSTKTHVFFRGKLPSKAALARAMKELGFPFAIRPATGSLDEQSGFMPMTLRREETGVELDVYSDHATVEEFAGKGVHASFERRASFRWGGDFQEAVAGMCGAAALAKLVNGVVFDEAENRLLSVDEAIAVARRNLETLLKPEMHFGTRPADIKRYLKPLLEQRSDLALIGRRLIIRPVRHVLRGAFLDRTSDKYQFRLWRYICPLFAGAEGAGYGGHIFSPISRVWEPHFESVLLDSLAEDIFDNVREIATLDDFARIGRDRSLHTLSVTALVLSGQREQAVATVDEVERMDDGHWRSWAVEQRNFLAREIDSVCAEFRGQGGRDGREAEARCDLGACSVWRRGIRRGTGDEVRRAPLRDDPLDQPTARVDWGGAGNAGRCSLRQKFAVAQGACDPAVADGARDGGGNASNSSGVRACGATGWKDTTHSSSRYGLEPARPRATTESSLCPGQELSLGSEWLPGARPNAVRRRFRSTGSREDAECNRL